MDTSQVELQVHTVEANDGDSLTAIVRCLADPLRLGAVFREIKGTDAALDLTVSAHLA